MKVPSALTAARVLSSRWLEAAQGFITGQPGLAADLYAAIGSRPDEAYTRLEAARQHIAANRTVEAHSELAVAFTFYREVRANAHLTEAKQLRATMLSSN